MRSKHRRLVSKLSEIAGTKTVTREQWLCVLAVFKTQEEKELERRG